MKQIFVKIFLFHRVSPQKDLLWNPISPQKFDFIISHLQKKYSLVQLEDFILNGTGQNKSLKPLAAIVFDDGYKDFLEYSLPILKKRNCASSMYVVTDCVNNQLPPWTYILDYHFIHSQKLQIDMNNEFLPSDLKETSFLSVEARINYAKKFKPFLKTISNAKRLELYKQVVDSLNDVTVTNGLMMNWGDLKQIMREGVEIGSHSKTHPLLAKIETKKEIETELKDSANTIQQNLGKFPISISYPIGSYNKEVKEAAIACGYKIGLAVNQICYNSSVHDNFEIPRIELYHESNFKVKLRVSGIIQKLNSWRR